MYCSNKITARGVLGFQGALGSLLLTPLYVNFIVIGEVPQDIRGVAQDDCRQVQKPGGTVIVCSFRSSH